VPPTPRTHALSRKAAMGRPKLHITRDRQFNVGLTATELAEVQRAARLAGMRPVDYGRAKLLSKPGRIARAEYAVRQLDPLLLVALSRIGNNLNQIARRLNELALPVPEDLDPLLAEIRSILASVQAP
jgi:hypothetical protein